MIIKIIVEAHKIIEIRYKFADFLARVVVKIRLSASDYFCICTAFRYKINRASKVSYLLYVMRHIKWIKILTYNLQTITNEKYWSLFHCALTPELYCMTPC